MSDQLEVAARIHENESVIARSRAVQARAAGQTADADRYELLASSEARLAREVRERIAAGD